MATKAEWVATYKSQNPTLKKMVNGVTSTMDSVEYEATIDSWATNSAAEDVREGIRESGGASAEYVRFRTDLQSGFGYKSIVDQLDQLWHDMEQGKLDKTGAWYLGVKAVKDKYPPIR